MLVNKIDTRSLNYKNLSLDDKLNLILKIGSLEFDSKSFYNSLRHNTSQSITLIGSRFDQKKDAELQRTRKINEDNLRLAQNKEKFPKTAYDNLIASGYTHEELVAVKHTWTLHYLLESAELFKEYILATPKESRADILQEFAQYHPDNLKSKLKSIRDSLQEERNFPALSF